MRRGSVLPVLLAAAAYALGGCGSCRGAAGTGHGDTDTDPGSRTPGDPATEATANLPADPVIDLPEIDSLALGLPSPDPMQDAMVTGTNRHHVLMEKGAYVAASQAIEWILEEHPGCLDAELAKASLAARATKPVLDVDALTRILLSGYSWIAPRVADDTAFSSFEGSDPEAWGRLQAAREAARTAWARTVSGPGAFVLATREPKIITAMDGSEVPFSPSVGWVVFVAADTGRFLPLTTARNVAGFILDRGGKKLDAITYDESLREQRDGEGNLVRPAVMLGVGVTRVDLVTFEETDQVSLGDDVVEVRLSERSGKLLAAIRRLDREDGTITAHDMEVDFASGKAAPAAGAAPAPTDVVVTCGSVGPPPGPGSEVSGGADGGGTDPSAVPEGWTCVVPAQGMRMCIVPEGHGSLAHRLVLERGEPGEGHPHAVLAKGLRFLLIALL